MLISSTLSAQNNDTIIEKEVYAGLSMNSFTGKDIDDSDMKMGFHAGITARYYFVGNYFIEGSFGIATKGYKSTTTTSSGQYWNDEGANYDGAKTVKYTSYNIEFPILVGYKFGINDDVNIKIKVGPYFTYAISGKQNVKGYRTVYPDIHSSETDYFDYDTKINDIDGFKNFGYGVHTGISADYKQFILSASYQRAFSKVFDDSKAYEQNILISLGYRF